MSSNYCSSSRAALAAAVLCFTALCDASFAQSLLPLEELGAALLARCDSSKPDDAGPSSTTTAETFLSRIAPLHDRVVVGRIELWLPREALSPSHEWKPVKPSRSTERLLECLARLQGLWIPRLTKENSAEAEREALELARWASAWKSSRARFGAGTHATTASSQTADRIAGRAPDAKPSKFGLVLCVAPTRAQFAALAGAYAAVDPAARSWVDQPWTHNALATVLGPTLRVVALTSPADEHPERLLNDVAVKTEESLQNAVHHAAHMISGTRQTHAPGWWKESLAIYDTMLLLGADEAPCFGVADLDDANSAYALVRRFWTDDRKSPFRGAGAEQFFRGALKRITFADGFEIVDFSEPSVRLRIAPPILGSSADVPPLVASGSVGVKQGYAEFYRAFGTAFVRFLDDDANPPSNLRRVCLELACRSAEPFDVSAFDKCVSTATGKTIGASLDAAKDLEAAFVASLLR